MSDRNPRKRHRNYKSFGSEFFDQLFGTNSKTKWQKNHHRQERRRRSENRGDARRWNREQKRLKRDWQKRNGWL